MANDITSADDLYLVEPSDFVAERNALVRRLREEGRREEATTVSALRRPSPSAWALNKAARAHPELLAEALDAGQQLREATEAAVAGDNSRLREATSAERAASERFLDVVAGDLGGQAGQQRAAATLRAAQLDPEVADQLRRGVLRGDHEASAFGFASGFEVGSTGSMRSAPVTRSAKAAPRRSDTERADDERQRQAERERQRSRTEAQREVARLERRAARLQEAAERAEHDAREARAAADGAVAELDEARGGLADL
ncbi:MAG: hypothetical protein ABWZ76_01570 [Acidimicrobiales bacterium]